MISEKGNIEIDEKSVEKIERLAGLIFTYEEKNIQNKLVKFLDI